MTTKLKLKERIKLECKDKNGNLKWIDIYDGEGNLIDRYEPEVSNNKPEV